MPTNGTPTAGTFRKDTRAALTDTDGDFSALQVTANGDLRVKDDDLYSALGGASLTFTRVVITQAGAGPVLLKAKGAAGTYNRLHALVVTMDAAGTLLIESNTTDAMDGTATALSGVIPIGTNGGVVIPFCAHKDGVLRAASGEALAIRSATGKVFGYAIVSQSTTA